MSSVEMTGRGAGFFLGAGLGLAAGFLGALGLTGRMAAAAFGTSTGRPGGRIATGAGTVLAEAPSLLPPLRFFSESDFFLDMELSLFHPLDALHAK